MLRVACVGFLAFLVVTHQWAGMIVPLGVCFVAGVLNAVCT